MSEEQKQKGRPVEEEHESLIRIMNYDIPGSKNLYVGLTKVKGISWAISNAVCLKLGFDKKMKVSQLSAADIEKIETFLKELDVPEFMKNRRFDPETGQTDHFLGIDLQLKKDFDIKRLKKIKSYKGIRHMSKLPVRGQRTRANFRKGGKAVGVKRKGK